jgi:transcriptional regulator with XRE-family HTH domain
MFDSDRKRDLRKGRCQMVDLSLSFASFGSNRFPSRHCHFRNPVRKQKSWWGAMVRATVHHSPLTKAEAVSDNEADAQGELMREARKSRGVSLREMAKRLGLSDHGQLSRAERGVASASDRIVRGYETVLDLPTGKLGSANTVGDQPEGNEQRRISGTSPYVIESQEVTIYLNGARQWYPKQDWNGRLDYIDHRVRIRSNIDGLDTYPMPLNYYIAPVSPVQVLEGGEGELGGDLSVTSGMPLMIHFRPLGRHERHEMSFRLDGWSLGTTTTMLVFVEVQHHQSLVVRFWTPPNHLPTLVAINGLPHFEALSNVEEAPLGNLPRVPFNSNGFARVEFKNLAIGRYYGVKWSV